MKKMIVLFAAASLFTACKKDEKPAETVAAAPTAASAGNALKVESITLGKAVDDKKQVTEAMTEFQPADTIHASVKTDGVMEKAALKVKWTLKNTDGEKMIHEEEQTFTSQGPATTDFMLTKTEGLQAGHYKVEVFQNANLVTQKEFNVGGTAAAEKKPASN